MRRPRASRRAPLVLALLCGATRAVCDDGPGDVASRAREVLAHHCFECHGGGRRPKGGLDLSTAAGLLAGGESGPAFSPGDAGGARLLRMLRHEEEPFMPLRRDALSGDDVAAIEAWIGAGAPEYRPLGEELSPADGPLVVTDEDRNWWAFLPLAELEPPEVRGAVWARNGVDRFALAQLEAAGLAPNPEADRRTLIRRLSFDLTGLPPEPEEVATFLADEAEGAYERLADRLLASPQFGERWARHWLDVARFAESHGYEHDYDRPNAYHYRDFVVRALNADMPFDRFLTWQLAGDEVAPEDPEALAATGFLAAGTHATQITASQVEKERYDELDDMLRTTSAAFLGLTVGCARCHDHKYDPLPARDYYSLLATFTTTVRSELEIVTNPAEHAAALAHWEAQRGELEAELARYEAVELPRAFDDWIEAGAPFAAEPDWLVLDLVSAVSTGGADLGPQGDGSWLASGPNADFDAYVLTAVSRAPVLTGLRVEALSDPTLAQGGPGRADNGNFALSDVRLVAAPLDGGSPALDVRLVEPRSSFDQGEHLQVAHTIDADPKSAWAVDPRFGADHAAAYCFAEPLELPGGAVLTLTLRFENNVRHGIGRVRVAVTSQDEPPALDALAAPAWLPAAAARRDRAALAPYHRALDPGLRAREERLAAHLAARPLPETRALLVASEGVPPIRLHSQGADFFEQTYHLERGDPGRKLEPAEPGFLTVLLRDGADSRDWRAEPPEGSRTSWRRLSLARWLTDSERGAGHLVARVIVNRLWQHHFGRGIVATPNDFGSQGAPPAQPELLDWLASELISNGWRLKPIHRLIVTSAVYRQSCAFDETRAAIDPSNELLWRRSPRRLEGEALRDALLAASGRLDRAQFGPGTLDPDHVRRSLYFTVKRSLLVPEMVLFDWPDGLQSLPVRAETTVAPQALHLLNSPQVRACAEALAERVAVRLLETRGADGSSVDWIFRCALSRDPGPDETRAAFAFLDEQARELGPGAALADLCQVVLCSSEFAYVD